MHLLRWQGMHAVVSERCLPYVCHPEIYGWWQQDSQRATSTDADEDACSDCISVSRASHLAHHHHLTDTEDSVMQVGRLSGVHHT